MQDSLSVKGQSFEQTIMITNYSFTSLIKMLKQSSDSALLDFKAYISRQSKRLEQIQVRVSET